MEGRGVPIAPSGKTDWDGIRRKFSGILTTLVVVVQIVVGTRYDGRIARRRIRDRDSGRARGSPSRWSDRPGASLLGDGFILPVVIDCLVAHAADQADVVRELA
jgi:hypothetical protein